MRVAFVAGVIEYSVCLANGLAKHCDIDFFYNGAYARQRDASTLTLLDPAIRQVEVNLHRLRDPRNFRDYRRMARRFADCDLVHLVNPNFWFSVNRDVYRNVPVVCTVHDPVQHEGTRFAARLFEDAAQRASVSLSSAIIVHGEKLKATLAGRYRIPAGQIAVIPVGDLSFYRRMAKRQSAPSDRSREGKQLLFFGEVRKNKGLDYLIKAEPLISASYSDYSILVAGKFLNEPENNLAYYQSLITNPGRFSFIDRFIANDEVAGMFEGCDIVVLPYTSASQSGILTVAFGFGKPVIATDTGSLGEVLEHGRTGLLVPPRDERALAEAVLRLLMNDEERLQLGRNAAAAASGPLGWDTIAAQTLAVYKRAIGGTSRRRASEASAAVL
jgi:glycosyltransferase involved in cell wall biosynthesis